MYMSDMLEGQVNTDPPPQVDLSKNIVTVTLVFGAGHAFVAVLTHYRHEGDVIELETECATLKACQEITAWLDLKQTVKLLEVDFGDTNVFTIDAEFSVEGAFMSNFDVVSGRALYGLKLRKIKPSVL